MQHLALRSSGAPAREPTRAEAGARGARREPAVVIESFAHPPSKSVTYLVYDDGTRVGLVIDPVGDPPGHRGEACGEITAMIEARGIDLQYALETRVRDDRWTGLAHFQDRFGALSVIGAGVRGLQERAARILAPGGGLATDGTQFDVLVSDGDVLRAGPLVVEARAVPPAATTSIAYRIGDALFVGDATWPPAPAVEHLRAPDARPADREAAAPEPARVFAGRVASAVLAGARPRPLAASRAALLWNLNAGRPLARTPAAERT